MPELPEVETIVRGLKPKIKGRKITGFWTDWPKYFPVRRHVVGKKIIDVSRRGKNVLLVLSDNHLLLIHQKMSGHLLVGKWKKVGRKWRSFIQGPLREDRNNQYIRLIFYLDNGQMLALSDLRRFAKVLCGPREMILGLPDLKELGPDALHLSEKEFTKLFPKKKGVIKTALMDQNFISGIGNIYADEILWLAGIHPLKRTEKLKPARIKVLYQSIKKILRKAIKLRGSSVDDYRLPSGERGSYDRVLLAYRQTGKKCRKKNCRGVIMRIVIGGRGTHFCPRHQK